MLRCVSEKVGIVRRVDRLSRSAEEPTIPILYTAMLSHHDLVTAAPIDRATMGKGRNADEAIRGALGEALERYCGYQTDFNALKITEAENLRGSAIMPDAFTLYSEAQYAANNLPFRRFDAARPVAWISGMSLPEHDKVWVPASLVYLSYIRNGADFFAIPTSSGMAAGQDLESATLNGLCELIERDAFLIGWLAKLPLPSVDVSGVGPIVDKIADHYVRNGLELRIVNCSLDQPAYVMLAVAIDRRGAHPAAVVGVGCDLNPVRSVEKALFEIAQLRAGALRSRVARRLLQYADVITFEDHGAFAAQPENSHEFDFLFSGLASSRLTSLENRSCGNVSGDLARVVAGLRSTGSVVAYVDLTTEDVANVGVRVVRTVATGLQPIHFGYGLERLGGRRLFELPKQLGLLSRVLNVPDINPCPHPLP